MGCAPPIKLIAPQPGPQTAFLASVADIAIMGGGAGSGKSMSLLLEPLRHVHRPGFGAVIFRRTRPEIKNTGGLWDGSQELYRLLSATPNETELSWDFPSGATVKFAGLQYDSDVHNWQGSQIALIGFDELVHFSEHQFFYMLSRNRSACGIDAYVRCTTNPDANSWVKSFLTPWLDRNHPDPAESGEIRWMVRDGGVVTWARTRQEHLDRDPKSLPKSVTFIHANVYDNPALLQANPGYLASLKALPWVERRRLLEGDWDIVSEGNLFKGSWFAPYWTVSGEGDSTVYKLHSGVEGNPRNYRRKDCRIFASVDTAASTRTTSDWSVIGIFAVTPDSDMIILDWWRGKAEAPELIKQLKLITSRHICSYIAIESNGALSLIQLARRSGLAIRSVPSRTDKVDRSSSAQIRAEAGQIYLPKEAGWRDPLVAEVLAFPTAGVHDDQVDVLSLACREVDRQGAPHPEDGPLAEERKKAAEEAAAEAALAAEKQWRNPMNDAFFGR